MEGVFQEIERALSTLRRAERERGFVRSWGGAAHLGRTRERWGKSLSSESSFARVTSGPFSATRNVFTFVSARGIASRVFPDSVSPGCPNFFSVHARRRTRCDTRVCVRACVLCVITVCSWCSARGCGTTTA